MIDLLNKNIPNELKHLSNWVCWNSAKQPINAMTGELAKPNDPTTWSDFNTAVQAVDKFDLRGVGFMFQAPYFGIDLDTVRNPDTGEICLDAQYILDTVVSYAEISQSGTGIHIICKADFKCKNHKKSLPCDTVIERKDKKGEPKKNEIEMYYEKRYFALTGNVYGNRTDITEQTDNVKAVYSKFMESKPLNSTKEGNSTLMMSETDILTVAMRDDIFCNLWHSKISDYQSHSEADLALCNKLAFYCGKNADMMDKLFRQSELIRDKWDEIHGPDTYGNITIKKAIADTVNVYDPNYNKVSHELYQREYIQQNGKGIYMVNCPLLENYFQNNETYFLVKNGFSSDVMFYMYINGCYKPMSSTEMKGYIKSMIPLALHSSKTIDEVYKLLINDYGNFTSIDRFNTDENIINFKNGLLHLDTMELKPHSPDVLSTIQVDCNYTPHVTPPKNSHFDKYMDFLTNGDTNKKRFLLQYMGMAISNVSGYKTKKSLFMVGKGDSGKTQIKELCVRLIGNEFVSSINLQTLEERFGCSNVFNKRLVGNNDMQYVRVRELSTFKMLTGGDSVTVEFKGKNSFPYIFKGVLWFGCNDLPKFGGDKGIHVYSRIIPLRCDNVVPEHMRDGNLLDKMYSEREYIIKLCVEGLKQVISNGYKYDIPDEALQELEKYKIDNDSVLQFIDTCCELKENRAFEKDEPTKGQIYQMYVQYCQINNIGYCESNRNFNKILQENDLGDIKKTHGGNEYYTKFKVNEFEQF